MLCGSLELLLYVCKIVFMISVNASIGQNIAIHFLYMLIISQISNEVTSLYSLVQMPNWSHQYVLHIEVCDLPPQNQHKVTSCIHKYISMSQNKGKIHAKCCFLLTKTRNYTYMLYIIKTCNSKTCNFKIPYL